MNYPRLFFLSWLFVVSPLFSMDDNKNPTILKEIIKRYKDRLQPAEDGPLIHKTDLLVVEFLDQKTIFDTGKDMIESSLEQEICLLYNEAQKKKTEKRILKKLKDFMKNMRVITMISIMLQCGEQGLMDFIR